MHQAGLPVGTAGRRGHDPSRAHAAAKGLERLLGRDKFRAIFLEITVSASHRSKAQNFVGRISFQRAKDVIDGGVV